MKRILLLSVIAVAIGFTSCANKEKCWQVTVGNSFISVKVYTWGTANDLNAEIDELKKEYGNDVKITKKSVNKSESDCWAANSGLFDLP